jgi:hypothetical protein
LHDGQGARSSSDWYSFKRFPYQRLKPFTEGREGRILLRSASYGGQEGSTTAAGGAHRAPGGTAGTGLSDPTLEPGGLRRLARRSAERGAQRRVLSFVSFVSFCEILNSAVVTMHGWLKVAAFGLVLLLKKHVVGDF